MKKRLLFLLSLLVLVFGFGLASCTSGEDDVEEENPSEEVVEGEETEGETEGDEGETEGEEEETTEPVQLNAVTIVIDSTNAMKIDWSASIKGVGGIAYYTISFADEDGEVVYTTSTTSTSYYLPNLLSNFDSVGTYYITVDIVSFDEEQYLEPTEDSNTVIMVIGTNDSEELTITSLTVSSEE